jgi:site-specific recombinase XerD
LTHEDREQFETWLIASRGNRPNTVRNNLGWAEIWSEWCKVHRIPWRTATVKHAETWYSQVVKRYSPSSALVALCSLRKLYQWAIANNETRMPNPFAGCTAPRQEEHIPAIVSVEELRRLLSACELASHRWMRLRNRALVLTVFAAGLRASEACGLEWADIDWSEGTITVRHGKGGNQRKLPVKGWALDALAEYRDNLPERFRQGRQYHPYVFVSQMNRRMSRGRLGTLMNELAAAAGNGHTYPHALRHGVATTMLNAGVDIRFIQAFLGHKNLSTTQRYTHVALGRLTDAYHASLPDDLTAS